MVGVYFPANGKLRHGRAQFRCGWQRFTHPFEYDPVANTWTTKSATYPDAHSKQHGLCVLNDAGTDYIYCVGGSQATVTGVFDRVFRYDPVTDAITTVAAPCPVLKEPSSCPAASASSRTSCTSWAGSTIPWR